MTALSGKKVLVGVTAGIAAYKTATLVRLLVKAGAHVKVVMTPASTHFITPLTLATLSKEPVLSEFANTKTGVWNSHVELGLWADIFLIAPLTSNTMGRMVNGIADNLLLTTYLSARCPVVVAPAMDLDMYQHPAVRRNLKQLVMDGVHIIPAGTGELASGLSGEGRMAEPEEIVAWLGRHFEVAQSLKGKKVVITTGPTFEQLDPVRFIGNYSTGKMGFALAEEALLRGAEVTLVSGPSNEQMDHPRLHLKRVTRALDMHKEVFKVYEDCDVAIMAAAVSDFRPNVIAEKKLKKEERIPRIELIENPDILRECGETKKSQFLVGFALETDNELEYAKGKLKRKNLDMIVMNSLKDPGAGFGTPTNKVSIILKDGSVEAYPLKSKQEVAEDIWNKIGEKL